MRVLALVFLLSFPASAAAAGFGVVAAVDPDRSPGVVVAAHGATYVVEVGDEPSLAVGLVLQVYRRLPSKRGNAAYRESGLWWEVGRLTVASVADGVALATQVSGPSPAVPEGLDESGAPADKVQIGDFVRTTGAVADRAAPARVVFPVAALFAPEASRPTDDGRRSIARWAAGVKRVEGPVEVRVRARLRELGVVSPDIDRSVSATRDAPEGPVAGDPVTPVIDLHGASSAPSEVPPARSVQVVEVRKGEEPETWQYLDPVTLAHRRASAVADAFAAAVGLDRSAVLVTVEPLPELSSHEDVPGYDQGGDAVWILASELEWQTPPPEVEPEPAPEKAPVEKPDEKRERRPFERFPAREVG